MAEVTSITVRMKHIRSARLCAKGTRDWWAAHGFSWSDFLANGIPAEKLASTGDPYALHVVKIATEDARGR